MSAVRGTIWGTVNKLEAHPSYGQDVQGTRVTLNCDVGWVSFVVPLGEPVPSLHDPIVVDWDSVNEPDGEDES